MTPPIPTAAKLETPDGDTYALDPGDVISAWAHDKLWSGVTLGDLPDICADPNAWIDIQSEWEAWGRGDGWSDDDELTVVGKAPAVIRIYARHIVSVGLIYGADV